MWWWHADPVFIAGYASVVSGSLAVVLSLDSDKTHRVVSIHYVHLQNGIDRDKRGW
jgi:hypothetical protein